MSRRSCWRLALLRAFRADDRGAVSLVTTLAMTVVVGIAAVSVDGGKYFLLRRTQQTATDFAAMAAASNLAKPGDLAVQASLADNFSAAAVSSVELGTYSGDSAVSAGQRFVPATAAPNAVRVTMATRPPFVFGGILAVVTGSASDRTGFDIRTRAVAVNQDLASFALGTQLASVDGGIENAVLGALLGSRLSLTAGDYRALASANVDLFSFSQAVATRANLGAVTYADVLQATVKTPQALNAVQDALKSAGGSSAATSALAQIIAAAGLSGSAVPLASLVSFGSSGDTALAAVHPTTASVSALTLLSAILEVANGRHQVNGSISTALPGIAAVDFSLAIGEAIKTASVTAVGPQGTSLHSAQTRLRLTITLAGTAPASVVTLPLYIETASATAIVAGLQCAVPSSPAATLNVQPGVADAWIGAVSDGDLTNLAVAPSVGNATFVNLLGLVQVVGSAHASIANMTPTPVAFSSADIASGAWKTSSTTDYTSSLYASLLGNLNLQVNAVGLGLGVPAGLKPAITQTLTGSAGSVDQLVTQVLGAVGVSVGNATTSVSAVRCGRSALAG